MTRLPTDGLVCVGSQFSGDSDRWDRCLRHLYQLLDRHLARIVKQGLAGGGGGGGGGDLSQPLLTLATRVCLQIYKGTETSGYIDVTQITASSSNKRRKIEVGLVPLADLLRSEGTLPHTLPWYQILLSLLTRHPQFFTEQRCLFMLEPLKQVMAACTHPPVQDTLMR
ncbi:Serine-protein kinase ATM [Chionoecetes opilio]|uniref:Serine-protein kinase ATM n=1 Tax=Chionoecetes opilio TaxID=41210 RepID=A0A8J4Y1B3_CHIOP|nr:Serine-protein kinase ATM [Chionoecetes opilio]